MTIDEMIKQNTTPFTLFMQNKWTWENVVDFYESYLNELCLEEDADHNQIRSIDSKLDKLFRIFRKDYAKILERRGKIDRAIKRVTTKAQAIPGRSNPEARKAAGIEAAENYQISKDLPPVNLYELEDKHDAYYQYFEYIGDTLHAKSWTLTRALGVNKLEGWLSR